MHRSLEAFESEVAQLLVLLYKIIIRCLELLNARFHESHVVDEVIDFVSSIKKLLLSNKLFPSVESHALELPMTVIKFAQAQFLAVNQVSKEFISLYA